MARLNPDGSKKALEVRVFLVMQTRPNGTRHVLNAKLSRASAEEIADALPNTEVVRFVATK